MDFEGHRPGERSYRRLIAGLFFAGVATFAQLYSPQAVLPFFSADLDIAPATAALAVSAATLGLAVAVIPWSVAADRFGRRATMATGIVVATLVGLLAPFAPTIEVFLAARLVEGLALGAVPAIALAYLNEEVHAGHAARAAGSYIAGTTVGGLAGRLIAGPFAEFGMWRGGVFAAAAVCAVCAVLFLWLSPRARRFTAVPTHPRALLGRLAANLRFTAQLALYAQAFLLMGGFVAVYNYLGFALAAPPYDLPLGFVSLLFLAYLGGTLSSPRAGALAARFGRLPVLLASIVVMAGGVLVTLVPALPVIVVGLVVFTAGFFGAHAVASGWTPASAPAGTPAQASSLYYLAYYAGSSAVGWALGFVFAGLGWGGVVGVVAGMCVVSVVLAVAGLRRAPDAVGWGRRG
ncbi:MAG: MFS transporter [Microbacterium sp.]|uniref:MFS transporter n=1 Tax=Microbacterium sp. TaxID=51671 RepID=UPI0026305B17|nr:MFS transporter [Microbacterium sp.]MCX6503500.1 MFS transporter [Microbacterium sp.]